MSRKRPKKSGGQTSPTVEHINPYLLKPSPENAKIYRPITRDDPGVQRMAEDMQKNGVLTPPIISADNFVISGHQRIEAAILAGLKTVPVIRSEVKRGGDVFDEASPEFVRLLTSHNIQRHKNRAEMLRESLIQTSPDAAYREIEHFRWEECQVKTETIKVGQRGRRKKISPEKQQMADAAIKIVTDNRNFWPLSDRQIHYRLLNNPPLRNTKKPKSRYRNDRASYQDLCDVLTRLRLNGRIPMKAISDPTRPTTTWTRHANTQSFIDEELKNFLMGYRRNLQQGQPLHIEVVAEKMTVESIVKPVCGRYHIPLTIARGYPGLPARADIADRFEASGKEKMLLLTLTDFDPEGISIAETILQSLREDFHLYAVEAVRVGLNQSHIERFNLIDNKAEAKKSSARYKEFVRRYGKQVYELESLSPEQLQMILEEAIQLNIDRDTFEAELAEEKKDCHFLSGVRGQVFDEVREILAEGHGDE
jgi:hypothetical protein